MNKHFFQFFPLKFMMWFLFNLWQNLFSSVLIYACLFEICCSLPLLHSLVLGFNIDGVIPIWQNSLFFSFIYIGKLPLVQVLFTVISVFLLLVHVLWSLHIMELRTVHNKTVYILIFKTIPLQLFHIFVLPCKSFICMPQIALCISNNVSEA